MARLNSYVTRSNKTMLKLHVGSGDPIKTPPSPSLPAIEDTCADMYKSHPSASLPSFSSLVPLAVLLKAIVYKLFSHVRRRKERRSCSRGALR